MSTGHNDSSTASAGAPAAAFGKVRALTRQALANPQAAVGRVRASGPWSRVRAHRVTSAAAAGRGPRAVLTPAEALRENGFTVFRGLIPVAECSRLAAELQAEAAITPGVEFTRVDATNKFVKARQVLFDPRLLDAVRATIGGAARFLQVSDLHYLHDTSGWHRDSVHRAADNTESADWSADKGTYGVVKAILYMESDNAAMGIMCGSHASPIEMDRTLVKAIETHGGQLVVDIDDEPNRRFSAAERRVPLAWKAQAGDVLVFDERMYHAGRRVDDGVVTNQKEADKFTLSLVFGLDNEHSDRLYSYFRYARRELHYQDFPPQFRQALSDHDLILTNGLGNYYEQHPQELRLAHLRNPEQMDDLVAQFTRAGARSGARSAAT